MSQLTLTFDNLILFPILYLKCKRLPKITAMWQPAVLEIKKWKAAKFHCCRTNNYLFAVVTMFLLATLDKMDQRRSAGTGNRPDFGSCDRRNLLCNILNFWGNSIFYLFYILPVIDSCLGTIAQFGRWLLGCDTPVYLCHRLT